jgi:hypothetical protein
MAREPSASEAAARLAILQAGWKPETVAAAQARFARERPRDYGSLSVLAAKRLRELRALAELANHLRAATRSLA